MLRAVGGLMGVFRFLALTVEEGAFRVDAVEVFFAEMLVADVFFVFALEVGVADLLATGFVVVSAGAAATAHRSRIDNAVTRYEILLSNIPSRSNPWPVRAAAGRPCKQAKAHSSTLKPQSRLRPYCAAMGTTSDTWATAAGGVEKPGRKPVAQGLPLLPVRAAYRLIPEVVPGSAAFSGRRVSEPPRFLDGTIATFAYASHPIPRRG
jgi:hypothetical protein